MVTFKLHAFKRGIAEKEEIFINNYKRKKLHFQILAITFDRTQYQKNYGFKKFYRTKRNKGKYY